jgi:hypothetical protein
MDASRKAAGVRSRRSVWPSLEEQLAVAKVIHGSALERLVADNQEFEMLRPEEAHDRLGVPPWLRVHWRKQHPDGDYSGASPSGGYPHLLPDIFEWMVAHQDLGGRASESSPPAPGGASRKRPGGGKRAPHGQ